MNDVLGWATLTVIAWGTWLVPSQREAQLDPRTKVVLVTLANLVLASLVMWGRPDAAMPPLVFSACFVGGLVWALSAAFAFRATARSGIARAMGTWAPLNIIVSLLWGALLFGEFRGVGPARGTAIGGAVLLLLVGIALVVTTDPEQSPAPASPGRRGATGLGAAIAAGVLWGSYFIPIRLADVSLWIAAWPMALGMFAGALATALAGRARLTAPTVRANAGVAASGLLWGIGNYGSLRLMELIGTGAGFSIAQLGIVVNALCGIHLFQWPAPGSAPARRILAGVLLALAGGAALGLAQ